MDRLSNKTKSNTPDLQNVNKLNEYRITMNGSTKDEITNMLNPHFNSIARIDNTKMVEKKIVNNKPSQFRPILGVNFHMLKK